MPSLPPAIDLHVHEKGGGILVVGLHDLTADGTRTMKALGPLTRGGRHVVAPDLRGHGESPTPHGPWSIDDIASDAARVVSAHGGNAILVGQGLGAAAALAVALGHPGIVAGLVLTGLSPRSETPEGRERWERVAGALREREREGWALATEALGCRPDWRGALAQLSAPTIVIAGAHDRAAPPAQQREIAAWSRRTRFEVIESGRDVFTEAPQILRAAVARLERIESLQAVAA
ncbi:MAG: alpha/beta fold hydrolase [Thermoleophilia bacterium]|nr:alpha/beta fold hydrolase [Thermoleophilia bacterium]